MDGVARLPHTTFQAKPTHLLLSEPQWLHQRRTSVTAYVVLWCAFQQHWMLLLAEEIPQLKYCKPIKHNAAITLVEVVIHLLHLNNIAKSKQRKKEAATLASRCMCVRMRCADIMATQVPPLPPRPLASFLVTYSSQQIPQWRRG